MFNLDNHHLHPFLPQQATSDYLSDDVHPASSPTDNYDLKAYYLAAHQALYYPEQPFEHGVINMRPAPPVHALPPYPTSFYVQHKQEWLPVYNPVPFHMHEHPNPFPVLPLHKEDGAIVIANQSMPLALPVSYNRPVRHEHILRAYDEGTAPFATPLTPAPAPASAAAAPAFPPPLSEPVLEYQHRYQEHERVYAPPDQPMMVSDEPEVVGPAATTMEVGYCEVQEHEQEYSAGAGPFLLLPLPPALPPFHPSSSSLAGAFTPLPRQSHIANTPAAPVIKTNEACNAQHDGRSNKGTSGPDPGGQPAARKLAPVGGIGSRELKIKIQEEEHGKRQQSRRPRKRKLSMRSELSGPSAASPLLSPPSSSSSQQTESSEHLSHQHRHQQPQKPQVEPQPSTSSSSPRRGREYPPRLACLFCRGRKIACGAPSPDSKDSTCNQCARRDLKCVFPTHCRRGARRKSTTTTTTPKLSSRPPKYRAPRPTASTTGPLDDGSGVEPPRSDTSRDGTDGHKMPRQRAPKMRKKSHGVGAVITSGPGLAPGSGLVAQ